MTARALQRTAQLLQYRNVVCRTRFYSQRVIQENDVVLLQRKGSGHNSLIPILTKPLVPGKEILIPHTRDLIPPEDIIGKRLRDIVISSRKGFQYRIFQPSLAEYCDLTPRLVTPIYSQDANLIVSLLDLHIASSGAENDGNEQPLEIFEAGTGHGALTLHLSRAIHGANDPPPRIRTEPKPSTAPDAEADLARKLYAVKDFARIRSTYMPADSEQADQVFDQCLADYIKVAGELGAKIEFSILAKNEEYSSDIKEQFRKLAEDELALPEQNLELFEKLHQRNFDFWRANRRAVIHTLDINEKHSRYAQKIVKNFRQGVYFPNIDFHIGTIENYLESRLAETYGNVFLDHAILDLPDTQKYLEVVGRAMKPGGSLITWNPNITQVIDCVETVREQRLPFLVEKVLEVGVGGGVGGREWDVRRVKLRNSNQSRLAMDGVPKESVNEIMASKGEEIVEDSADVISPTANDNARYEIVCRPKVGTRVIGGGFIGLWRRMEQH